MLDWLPENVSTFGAAVDALFAQIYYLTSAIMVMVFAVMAFFLIKYRQRPDRKASYATGNATLEVIWTSVTFLILIVLAIASKPIWATIKERPSPPAEQFTVQVIGKQFNWIIKYPGPDRLLGTDDDLEAENELYVPVDTDIWILLASEDVIHSFFVPQFRLKQDAVPGREIPAWFRVTKPGTYELACAELCGFGHSTMRGWVHVLSPEAYDAWLREQWPSGGV
jgi:cytochrome c oxidase subunit II